jgi:glycosyltransferase involved in cell wall biosynthesis
MKIVAALRIKNEEWIIKYNLSALSEFVDEIVIVDDGSTDNTINFAKQFKKVTSIHVNKPKNDLDIDELKDWNKMTQLAIKQSADYILFTDADEVLEPSIKKKIHNLLSKKDILLFKFRKVSPWKGFDRIRSDNPRYDRPAIDNFNPVLVRVTKDLKWKSTRGNLLKRLAKRVLRGEKLKPNYGRMLKHIPENRIECVDEIVAVHFNNIDHDRLLKKQVYYALREKAMRPQKKFEEIIDWVARGWSEENLTFKNFNKTWLWNKYVDLIDLKKNQKN